MQRVLYFIVLSSLSVFALGPTAAVALSPSQEQCEADGGTFSREGGKVKCITTTNVGNSPNSQTTTTTDGSNGTLNNDPQFSTNCKGPANSTTSAHCK